MRGKNVICADLRSHGLEEGIIAGEKVYGYDDSFLIMLHRRACSRLVCGKCSPHLIIYHELGEVPVRACDECKSNLKPEEGVLTTPAAMLEAAYY